MRKSYISSTVLLFIIAVFLTLQMPRSVDAAQTVYLALEMAVGGTIEGESTIADREDTIEIYTFSNQMWNNGKKKSYGVIKFVKQIDKSTPLLYRAMDTNDRVSEAVFKFYRPSHGGSRVEEHYLTFKVEGGNITNIQSVSDALKAFGEVSMPHVETVTMRYDTVTITYEIGGATYRIIQPWLER